MKPVEASPSGSNVDGPATENTAGHPLGIKALDVENWLAPDKAASVFAYVTPEGIGRSMDGHEWARVFLAPRLSPGCPRSVLISFEAARGPLLYGYYFYPLYALGIRELLHVAEMAARLRCEQLGLSKRATRSFSQQITSLRDAGEMTGDEAGSWTRLRQVRNSLVHTSTATITMPGEAVHILDRIATLINALYGGQSRHQDVLDTR